MVIRYFSITSAIRLRRRFIAFAVLALCSVLIPSFSKTREGATDDFPAIYLATIIFIDIAPDS
jgi:hypothetical protein